MPTRSSAAPPSRTSRAGSQPCSDTERPASSSLAFPVRTDHAVRRTTWDCRKGAGWVSICQSHVVRPSPPPLSPRNGAAAPPLCRRNVLEDVLQRLQRHKRHDPPRAPPVPAPRAATRACAPSATALACCNLQRTSSSRCHTAVVLPPPQPPRPQSSRCHSRRASASFASPPQAEQLAGISTLARRRSAAAPQPPPTAAAPADGRRPRRRPASARLRAADPRAFTPSGSSAASATGRIASRAPTPLTPQLGAAADAPPARVAT